MPKRVFPSLLLPLSLAVGAGVCDRAAAVTPISGEFQVNTYTYANQYRSRMSMSTDGRFVVTWASPGDGSGFGIVAQRFESAGAPIGAELQVNTYTLQDQQYPAVSLNDAGQFVVVWHSSIDAVQSDIFARRYDSTGAPIGTDFQVNTYTPGSQTFAGAAIGRVGGFFVVWQSPEQDGSGAGIFARRHNLSGVPQAAEFQVNELTLGDQRSPRITILEPSDLLVVWDDGDGVFARRVGQTGVVGSEFQIDESTAGGGVAPSVAPTADGGFVVAWQGFSDGDSAGIKARRFDSLGAPLATELQINAHTVDSQTTADIAGNGTDFVVTWQSNYQDGDQWGVFARRLDAAGLVGSEIQVNVYTTGPQLAPSVGTSENGVFVVTWNSVQDGSYNGVFARRFTRSDLATLDVDGDGSTEPLTDGLLVLRFLFGFSGPTLVGGAVGPGCLRCDEAAISSWIAGLGDTLDVDDNGAPDALTDGLLLLRYLFGFTGTALTNGATADDCVRCDAGDIESYLLPLV